MKDNRAVDREKEILGQMSNTEVIEKICGVTIHGLDRINERFSDNIGDLIDAILGHIKHITTFKITGPCTYTFRGISTVMEMIDNVPTLVTAYPSIKDDSYTPQGKYKGKKNRKNKKKGRVN